MPMGGNSTGAACGDVKHWPTASAPAGWLKANGAAVSRTTYAALFAIIGTTYGAGDGATTFNLPDLRGEFVRGLDDGRGVDPGRVIGASQLDALQNISGSVYGSNLTSVRESPSGVFAGSLGGAGVFRSTFSPTGSQAMDFLSFDASNSAGARTGAETRPRNVAMLACIKY